MEARPATRLIVDADACPVKDEVYRVAKRYGLKTLVVANSPMGVPPDALVELVVVAGDFDAADDWIAGQVTAADIVVTADIPLAARCLEAGARALDHKGRVFTPDSIGDALASRELMAHLRQLGDITGGPRPFTPRDRSSFLQSLDALVHAIRKAGA